MLAFTLWLGFAWSNLAVSAAHSHGGIQPTEDSAKANAHHIFNVIHSAGRQWGSSLNHNGFSFFPAVVPKGTMLYHGSRYNHPPATLEWMAFEIEHSQNFAVSFSTPDGSGHGRKPEAEAESQIPLGASSAPPKQSKNSRGYLQSYRATRDLKLLYVDGTSAGKTTLGTLDSQDLVLLENRTTGRFHEFERARGLCDLVTDWGYDGLVRMEIGFEVIYCDFSDGINMTSATRTFLNHDMMGSLDSMNYHWARAASERYDGVMVDRLRLDFSSMVSGFFFPVNISNTDPDRPDLIRLAAASLDQLKDIKTHVEHVCKQPRRFTINWQTAVDLVVTRFSTGLALMGWDGVVDHDFVQELEHLTLPFFDAPSKPEDMDPDAEVAKNATQQAVERCINNYLLPWLLEQDEWSLEDRLIHTALETVLGEICTDLFAMRTLLLDASPDLSTSGYRIKLEPGSEKFYKALQTSRGITRSLMKRLAWTHWKKTLPCRPDEFVFVAMWPLGKDEDHWQPGCRTIQQMRIGPGGYWNPEWNWPKLI